jgi:hypothetical protein
VHPGGQVDSTRWWPAHLGVRLDARVLHDAVFQSSSRNSRETNRSSISARDAQASNLRLYFEQDGTGPRPADVAANVIGGLHDMLPPINRPDSYFSREVSSS